KRSAKARTEKRNRLSTQEMQNAAVEDGFDQLACRVEALLGTTAQDSAAAREVYRYAMRCELKFFSGALQDQT
ncbi:MAG: hypothetical protein JXQ75_03785, partial [Phycisphaerae bacterium]|nr:hypothetical protein [Phycisphaerae bacterium]